MRHAATIKPAGGDVQQRPRGSLAGRSLIATAVAAAAGLEPSGTAVSQYHGATSSTGAFMLVSGKWKLIEYGRTHRSARLYPAQLFDLDLDPTELVNLASSHPDKVAVMQAELGLQLNVTAIDRDAMAHQYEVHRFQVRAYS